MIRYILLIDSDEGEHDFFQSVIDKFNPEFRMLSAFSGKKGVHIFRKIWPTVTFINFELEDMNGIACLQKIKSLKGAQHIPVYLYYTQKNIHLRKNAETMGATGFLVTSGQDNEVLDSLYRILTLQSAV